MVTHFDLAARNATDANSMQTRILPIYMPAEGADEAPPAYTTANTQQQMASSAEDANVQIWPLPDKGGLIVTVEPPRAPQDEKRPHVPCDIVLVIDVSGSMSDEAWMAGSSDKESTGLSVLDLVKHACRTILSTLNEGDRLGIITFSNSATEIQKLTVMTDDNKKAAEENIEKMYVQGSTNLWAGLRKGIECLSNEGHTGRVPAVMLLTDGLPNYMCPPGGYVPELKKMGHILPTVHTFGFGSKLRSGLLKSISEFGQGNYSFIPDAGMIGTVFVHAVAHLQSTFATSAVLNLSYPGHIIMEQTAGASVDQNQPQLIDGRPARHHRLTIALGNIQYGQTRDIFLSWTNKGQKCDENAEEPIQAMLEYDLEGSKMKCTRSCVRPFNTSETRLTSAQIAYHISRHKVLAFLASLFPIDCLGEHRPYTPQVSFHLARAIDQRSSEKKDQHHEKGTLEQKQVELRNLVAALPAAEFPNDPQCASIMQDLISPEPYGQISLALSKHSFFSRWGQHYLLSIHSAHSRQLCNSFKDPGPLQYGLDSAFFINCRNALNKAFDDLPPPTPSILPVPELYQQYNNRLEAAGGRPDGHDLSLMSTSTKMADGRNFRLTESMSSYNMPSNPCFAGSTLVTLASGNRVRISALQRGMSVVTPMGPRKVALVLVTPVKGLSLTKLADVLVTPWHPVAMSLGEDGTAEAKGWMFPGHASLVRVKYTGCIYSVLLQRDESIDAHAMMLGGDSDGTTFWGVTLGHGMLTGPDPRAHRFFGDYDRVIMSLKTLRVTNDGRAVTGGIKRSTNTGLVCGFKCYEGRKPS